MNSYAAVIKCKKCGSQRLLGKYTDNPYCLDCAQTMKDIHESKTKFKLYMLPWLLLFLVSLPIMPFISFIMFIRGEICTKHR